MSCRRVASLIACVVASVLVAGTPSPAAAAAPACTGDLTAAGVPQKPGPALRFGITPAGEAGALGPRVEPVPEQPERTHEALARLRAPGTALVLRLNRFFWSEGEAGVQ